MFKVRYCFWSLLVVSLMMIVSSCSDSKQDYVCVIPNDATAVVGMDLNSLALKSELGSSSAITTLKKYMGVFISTDARTKMETLIDDPSLSGLDFSQPAYMFMTPNQCVGLTFKVDDCSMLENIIETLAGQGICSGIKEHDGYQWSTLMDDINICFSDNTLLLMTQLEGTAMSGSARLQSLMLSLMQMPSEESFASGDCFRRMNSQECGDIQFYANLAVVPSEYMQNVKLPLPVGARYSDIQLVGGADFNKGGAMLKTQLYSDSEKVQKMIDDIYSSFKPIEGQFTDNAGDYICFTAGVNGGKILNYLKAIPQVKEYLIGANLAIDCDNIIKSFDGDILFCMNSGNSYSLYAHMGNADVMKDIDDWKQSAEEYGFGFSEVGSNQYRIIVDDNDWFMAYSKETLYVGSEARELSNGTKSDRLPEEQKGRNIFVNVNMKDRYPLVDKVVITSSGVGEMTYVIDMRDKSENILKILLGQWKL